MASWCWDPLLSEPPLSFEPQLVAADAESSWLGFEEVNWPLFRCILQYQQHKLAREKTKALMFLIKHQNPIAHTNYHINEKQSDRRIKQGWETIVIKQQISYLSATSLRTVYRIFLSKFRSFRFSRNLIKDANLWGTLNLWGVPDSPWCVIQY